MDVSGQLHILATSMPGKKLPITMWAQVGLDAVEKIKILH
jgi:hypothetical protein